MVQKCIDAKKLDAKGVIDHDALKAAGLARGGKDGVRLLGKGELTAKVVFKVAGASKGAIEAVEKAGGKVEVIAAAVPEAEKKLRGVKPTRRPERRRTQVNGTSEQGGVPQPRPLPIWADARPEPEGNRRQD